MSMFDKKQEPFVTSWYYKDGEVFISTFDDYVAELDCESGDEVDASLQHDGCVLSDTSTSREWNYRRLFRTVYHENLDAAIEYIKDNISQELSRDFDDAVENKNIEFYSYLDSEEAGCSFKEYMKQQSSASIDRGNTVDEDLGLSDMDSSDISDILEK